MGLDMEPVSGAGTISGADTVDDLCACHRGYAARF